MNRDVIILLKDGEKTPYNVGWLAGHYDQERSDAHARFMGMETRDEMAEWDRGYAAALEADPETRDATLSLITELV